MIGVMKFAVFFLFYIVSSAAWASIVDYGPPQDALGHWEFDLYDATGAQRATTSNPLFFTTPAGAASTSALQVTGNTALTAIQTNTANTASYLSNLSTLATTTLQNTEIGYLQTIATASSAVPDSVKATYSASTVNGSVIASPTDIFCISGSATKLVRVMRLAFTATQTTAAQRDVLIYKRTVANTGGTSVTVPNIQHDTTDVAGTAVVKTYTANPTLGTSPGFFRARKVYIGGGTANSDELILEFGANDSKQMLLRGAAESICVNLNGVTSVGLSVDISVTWTEE